MEISGLTMTGAADDGKAFSENVAMNNENSMTQAPQELPSLAGLSRDEIKQHLTGLGVEPRHLSMRCQQIWHWIYVRGARNFDDMTSISKSLRQQLADSFSLRRPDIVSRQISEDGTRKWLLRLPASRATREAGESAATQSPSANRDVECVYIPEANRGTLCVSSQVGCTLNCSFCHTGTQAWVANLSAADIVGQMLVARDELGEWPTGDERVHAEKPRSRLITNLVFMGMGEPLYNFENVRSAVDIISDNEGLSLSRRRITLSTAGVVPQIPRWGEQAATMLAISLHAAEDGLRDQLVPLNRKYPIAQLMDACRNYPGLSNAKRITFEYVMLDGINDRPQDAKKLVQLLKSIPAKINLIPFNPWPGSQYHCSQPEAIERFAEIVNRAGYASPVRSPRGRDIMAACGQLKSQSIKLSARERRARVAIPAQLEGSDIR